MSCGYWLPYVYVKGMSTLLFCKQWEYIYPNQMLLKQNKGDWGFFFLVEL